MHWFPANSAERRSTCTKKSRRIPASPLLKLENLLLTPHVAAFTLENFHRVSLVVSKAVHRCV